jgi:hypothetical protein
VVHDVLEDECGITEVEGITSERGSLLVIGRVEMLLGVVKLLGEPVDADHLVAATVELPDMPPLSAPEVEMRPPADSSAGGHDGLAHHGHALMLGRL